MNLVKSKNHILRYLLLVVVLIFSACSKNGDFDDSIEIIPVEDNSNEDRSTLDGESTKAPQDEASNSPNQEVSIDNNEDINNTISEVDIADLGEADSGDSISSGTVSSGSVVDDTGLDDSDLNSTDLDVSDYDVSGSDDFGSDDSGSENSGSDNSGSDISNSVGDNSLNNNSEDSNSEDKDATAYDPEDNSTDDNDLSTSEKRIIVIDAGHQGKGNYDEEPIGPGATKTKPKVSSGTQGVYTGVAEYKLTLVIAKKVKEELINRGYEVVMIRETHEVNLSNKERAEIANDSGADLFLRIHADGSTNPDANGASTLYPSKDNPYVADLSDASYDLSKDIIDAICDSTGAKNRGAIARDDMSGINWCKIPVSIIEMGYMSNKKEDQLMQTKEYQDKIVKGICDGIDNYYE